MSDHRERDCPKCGDSTTVPDEENDPRPASNNDLRQCDNPECNWCVEISGGIV